MALEKLDIGGDYLCNLATGNGNPICVRNIEGHITPQHTVYTYNRDCTYNRDPRVCNGNGGSWCIKCQR